MMPLEFTKNIKKDNTNFNKKMSSGNIMRLEGIIQGNKVKKDNLKMMMGNINDILKHYKIDKQEDYMTYLQEGNVKGCLSILSEIAKRVREEELENLYKHFSDLCTNETLSGYSGKDYVVRALQRAIEDVVYPDAYNLEKDGLRLTLLKLIYEKQIHIAFTGDKKAKFTTALDPHCISEDDFFIYDIANDLNAINGLLQVHIVLTKHLPEMSVETANNYLAQLEACCKEDYIHCLQTFNSQYSASNKSFIDIDQDLVACVMDCMEHMEDSVSLKEQMRIFSALFSKDVEKICKAFKKDYLPVMKEKKRQEAIAKGKILSEKECKKKAESAYANPMRDMIQKITDHFKEQYQSNNISYDILRGVDDASKGLARTQGATKRFFYFLAFALGLNLKKEEGERIDYSVEHFLQTYFYNGHIASASKNPKSYEMTAPERGIDYKNFEEIIYLYYLEAYKNDPNSFLCVGEAAMKAVLTVKDVDAVLKAIQKEEQAKKENQENQEQENTQDNKVVVYTRDMKESYDQMQFKDDLEFKAFLVDKFSASYLIMNEKANMLKINDEMDGIIDDLKEDMEDIKNVALTNTPKKYEQQEKIKSMIDRTNNTVTQCIRKIGLDGYKIKTRFECLLCVSLYMYLSYINYGTRITFEKYRKELNEYLEDGSFPLFSWSRIDDVYFIILLYEADALVFVDPLKQKK